MHAIIVGGGKTVYFLAKQFASKGYYTTIINHDPLEAQWLSRQLKATVVLGDGTTVSILEAAETRQADIFVSLLPHDEDNLVACQLAQRVFGVPRTISLINDPEHEEVFQKLGVTSAVSTAQIIARMIEEQAGFEEITSLMSIAKGQMSFTELVLMRDAPAVGKTLSELSLPDNSLVAAIIRGDEVTVPWGSSRLQALDHLILVTQPENHGAVLRLLTGEKM